MTSKLFSAYEVRGVTFRNRIVMSPMCMYSCFGKDGKPSDWHLAHYASRAQGGVGLVMLEATAVTPEGRITDHDMGIWSDDHIPGLARIAAACSAAGAKTGIQIAHAGRKSESAGRNVAPSAIPYSERYPVPEEMTAADIEQTVGAFQAAARRAAAAGFDVIEIHAAHGYLLSEFLSPLANRRTDRYGGDRKGRFRMLGEVITAVRKVWDGPLFVRLSLTEYAPGGNSPEDMIWFAKQLKALGVDLIDASSGGVVSVKIEAYPGFQLPMAARVRKEAEIPVGAVGLITEPSFAEYLLRAEMADLIFLGRVLLREPYWPLHAAKALKAPAPIPFQYEREDGSRRMLFRKILVAFDGSPQSRAALQKGIALAQAGGGTIVDAIYVSHAPGVWYPEMPAVNLYEMEAATTRKLLEEAKQALAASGCRWHVFSASGRPAKAIVEHAAEGGYDLIIMGSRGLSGLTELFLGSVSHNVVQHSPIPVLIIKDAGGQGTGT